MDELKTLGFLVDDYKRIERHMKEARENHKDYLECFYEGYLESLIMTARALGLGDDLKKWTGAPVWGAFSVPTSRGLQKSDFTIKGEE